MRLVQTDDAAWRLEFRWLGPVNLPMPVPARGGAWIAGVLLWAPMAFITTALLPQPLIAAIVPGPAALLLAFALTIVAATAATVVLVRLAGRIITPTRPLRHHAALLVAELTGPREEPDVEHRCTVPDELWIENRGVRTHWIDAATVLPAPPPITTHHR